MRNFGEIIINPDRLFLEPSTENSPIITEKFKSKKLENSPEKKRAFIEYIKQFDEAHENKELSPEDRKKIKRKIYAGIAIATLAAGTYYADNKDELFPEKTTVKYEMGSVENPTKNNLQELRAKVNQEYEKNNLPLEIKSEPQIQKNVETKKIEEQKEKEPPPKERLEKANDLAIKLQAVSRNVLKNNEFFPKKIFSDDFLLAIQAQESGFDKGAQSHKGAVGAMQVMPETIKEVLLYINKIDNRINFQGKELTEELVNDLTYLIKQNPDLGKAFGNLYLAEIFNNFDIGKKSLENNWITLGRKKILAVYNWGISKFMRNATNEDNWPAETKNYINNISADIEVFKEINSKLGINENNDTLKPIKRTTEKTAQVEIINLKTNPEFIKENIILELRKFREDKGIDYAKINTGEIINYYLGEIKIKESLEKKPLKKETLQKLVKDLNYKIFKKFAADRGLAKQKSPV